MGENESVYNVLLNNLYEREAKAISMVNEAGAMTRENLARWSVSDLVSKASDFRRRERSIFELQNAIEVQIQNLSDPNIRKQMTERETLDVIEELAHLLTRKVREFVFNPMEEVQDDVQGRMVTLLQQYAEENARLKLELDEAEKLLKHEREKKCQPRQVGGFSGDEEEG